MDMFFREVRAKPYFSRDDDINYAAHIHDDVEVIYVFRGEGTAFCDGKQYTLGPGDVFIVFPDQIHSYVDFSQGEYILLVINPSRLLYLEEFIRSRIPVSALCTGSPTLACLITDALTEFRAKSNGCIMDGYLTAFFGKLFQSMQFQQRSDLGDTVSRILSYCSQHYLEPITTRELCREFHISQSYVSHIFSGRLKISFSDYINAMRLNKAVPLLREPGLNMTQVAERAGFPTIRTFNRVFRRQFGCSPSEYRLRQAKKKQDR